MSIKIVWQLDIQPAQRVLYKQITKELSRLRAQKIIALYFSLNNHNIYNPVGLRLQMRSSNVQLLNDADRLAFRSAVNVMALFGLVYQQRMIDGEYVFQLEP